MGCLFRDFKISKFFNNFYRVTTSSCFKFSLEFHSHDTDTIWTNFCSSKFSFSLLKDMLDIQLLQMQYVFEIIYELASEYYFHPVDNKQTKEYIY